MSKKVYVRAAVETGASTGVATTVLALLSASALASFGLVTAGHLAPSPIERARPGAEATLLEPPASVVITPRTVTGPGSTGPTKRPGTRSRSGPVVALPVAAIPALLPTPSFSAATPTPSTTGSGDAVAAQEPPAPGPGSPPAVAEPPVVALPPVVPVPPVVVTRPTVPTFTTPPIQISADASGHHGHKAKKAKKAKKRKNETSQGRGPDRGHDPRGSRADHQRPGKPGGVAVTARAQPVDPGHKSAATSGCSKRRAPRAHDQHASPRRHTSEHAQTKDSARPAGRTNGVARTSRPASKHGDHGAARVGRPRSAPAAGAAVDRGQHPGHADRSRGSSNRVSKNPGNRNPGSKNPGNKPVGRTAGNGPGN
ncbi:MAG: hypothetical protein ACXV2J_13025, partial [Actinomycetes bacterium]